VCTDNKYIASYDAMIFSKLAKKEALIFNYLRVIHAWMELWERKSNFSI
jgi:hypothetical protein